jgi:hypothetical protein
MQPAREIDIGMTVTDEGPETRIGHSLLSTRSCALGPDSRMNGDVKLRNAGDTRQSGAKLVISDLPQAR